MTESKRIGIYLPVELIERMKAVAQGRKVSEMIREAIIQWLKVQEKS